MGAFRGKLRGRSRKGALLGATSALLALLVAVGAAHGDVKRNGNILVAFHGGIAPAKLPRFKPAPVNVLLGGKIRTTDHSKPPKLDRIVFDINRHGKINIDRLPRCTAAKLNNATTRTAEAKCGAAQVGHGNVTTRVALPGQGEFASNGKLLAFNARVHGKPAILAHVHGERPLQLTYVMTFLIKKKRKGVFGTTLVSNVPEISGGFGYISAFDLTLSRRWRSHGKRMSYISANCPAPGGLPGASFSFARATYHFADGRSLHQVLSKDCRVRR